MVAEVVETIKGPQKGEVCTHWDIIEVWENKIEPEDKDQDDQIEVGVDVAQDTWPRSTNIDMLTGARTTIDWERKEDSDAMNINDQKDVESEIFWDALSGQESDMEDEVF